MKYLFSLLITSLSFALYSQEIARLDSIVEIDLNDGEITKEAYLYDEEDRLSILTFDDENALTFNYNENGTINKLDLDDTDLGQVPYIFTYDTDGNLNAINASFMSDGYEITLIWDIDSDAGQVNRVTHTQVYGGYPFEEFDKIFKFLPNGKVDSIIFLDIFEYDEDVVENYYNYRYEDEQLTAIDRYSFLFPTNAHTDTLGYFPDGTLAFVDRNGVNPDEFDFLKIEYTDPVTFADDEFIGPDAMFEVIDIISDENEITFMTSLAVNSRPASHIQDNEFNSVSGTWYYSILVNTDEEEIPAAAMTVFPNPATDVITLGVESIESYEIYSMTGDLVSKQVTSSNTIDITYLTNGNYVIVARDYKGKNFFSKIHKF